MKLNYKFLIAFVFIIFVAIIAISEAGPQKVDFYFNLSKNASIDRDFFYSSSIILEVNTDKDVNCKYSLNKNVPYSAMEGNFDENYGIVHRKILTSLSDGIHKYYIKCSLKNGTNFGNKLEAIFRTSSPVSVKISFSEKPPLKAGKYEVELITSKIVIDKPELSYSFDGTDYKTISLFGSGKKWEGYMVLPENLGEVIGSFKFKARGMSGVEGTEITENNVFLVDTEKPETISTIEARGYEGQIRLKWYLDEDIEDFNIYKSKNPNVDYTHFYEPIDDKEYIDNDVNKGETYYYRVAAVDEAGNIARLSKEVHATALFNENTTQENGLDIELRGQVDNFINEINLIVEDISDIESSFSLKDEKISKIIEDLELEEETNNAKRELNSLKRDVEKYKQQDLSQTELEGKINSARLRLNIIKKRVPEDIIILDEKSKKRDIKEQDINKALLEYDNELGENIVEQSIKSSLKLIQEKEVNINSELYVIEVIYLDGTKKELTLIKDKLNSKLERNKDNFIIYIIPKSIAESSNELNLNNLNYEVIKEDPVLSFGADTKEITYTLNKQINIESLEDISIIPINLVLPESESGFMLDFTGFFVFENGISTKSIMGIIVLVVVIIALLVYFLYIKKRKKSGNILECFEKLKKVNSLIKEGKEKDAEKIYLELKGKYKELSEKDKKKIYSKISKIKGNSEIKKDKQ